MVYLAYRDFCIVELLSHKAYNTVGIEYSMIEVAQTSTSLGALIGLYLSHYSC